MSIDERMKDGRLLYEARRYEGALLCVLVSIGATSRKRYERTEIWHDGDAFCKFLAEEAKRHRVIPLKMAVGQAAPPRADAAAVRARRHAASSQPQRGRL